MKQLDRYLLRESVTPLVFGLMLYSLLAVLSGVLPRLQWIIGKPLDDFFLWLIMLMPQAIVQTLPIALLLAVLLVFGRLAANSELLAVQAGGIKLRRMTMLFIVMGFIAALASGLINEYVIPHSNAKVGSLYWQMTSSGGSGIRRLVNQNIPLDNYSLYFSRVNREKNLLADVRLESWEADELVVIFANRAEFVGNTLKLFNYRHYCLDLASLSQPDVDHDIMLRSLVRCKNQASRANQSLSIVTSDSYDDIITRFSQGGFEDTRSIREALADSNNESLTASERRKAAVLFHRKLAEPAANLVLLLVAVPVAVLYARSRSIAFGLSLVVTLVWYIFLALGQLFAQTEVVPIWLGLWSGNILLAIFGMYLLLARTNLR